MKGIDTAVSVCFHSRHRVTLKAQGRTLNNLSTVLSTALVFFDDIENSVDVF